MVDEKRRTKREGKENSEAMSLPLVSENGSHAKIMFENSGKTQVRYNEYHYKHKENVVQENIDIGDQKDY